MKSAGTTGHSQISAKIAAFFSKEAAARFRVSGGQASSRIQYIFSTTACWLEARTRTSPPLLLKPP
jgi:hypothetical protein